MRNMFSLMTNSIMKDIHNISISNQKKPTSKIDEMWNKYIRNSMLFITSDDEKRINESKSIGRIADVCIDIAKPLFRFPESNIKYPGKDNQYDVLEQLTKHSITNTEKNGYDIRFFEEIKRFLIRSFIYHQSCNTELAPINIQDVQNIFNSLLKSNSRIKNLSKCLYNLNKSPNKFRCYLQDSAGKFNYSPKVYLDFIFEYRKRKRYSYKLSSWYDALIFIGLVYSSSPLSNPFIENDNLEKKRKKACDLDQFLNWFSPHLLDIRKTSFLDLNDIVLRSISKYAFNTLPESLGKILNANLLFWHDVTMYLIERLTNVNYIHRIAKLHMDHPQFSSWDSLYHFGAYPLLSYRLDAIDRFSVLFNDGKDDWKEYNDRLVALIRHHLFVAFPQLDALFNLSLLRNGYFFDSIPTAECSKILDGCPPLFNINFLQDEKMSCDVVFKNDKLKNTIAKNTLFPYIQKPSRISIKKFKKIIDSVYLTFGDYAIHGNTLEKSANYPSADDMAFIRCNMSVYISNIINEILVSEKEEMNIKNYGKPIPFMIHA